MSKGEGFVYLLKIFGKKTRDWTKNCNSISQQDVLTMISYLE
jgi:hypothetical protein